jgi:hypothetical protein
MKHIHRSRIGGCVLRFWGVFFLPGTQLIRPFNATEWWQNMTVVMFGENYVVMKLILKNKNCKPEILKFRDLQRLSDHWLGSSLGVQPTYVFHSFTFTSCIRKTKNKLIIFLKCKKFFSLSQNLNIVLTISSIDTTNQIWSKSVMCIEKSDMETGRWIVDILRGT